MKIKGFIKHVKMHKDQFVCYCEILISPEGEIVFANPSHTEALIRIAQEAFDTDREGIRNMIGAEFLPMHYLIDRLGYISVWYNMATTPLHITDEQVECLRELKKEKIISADLHVQFTHEYQLSEWRNNIEKIFKEEK